MTSVSCLIGQSLILRSTSKTDSNLDSPGSLIITLGGCLDLFEPPLSIISLELAAYQGLLISCPVPTTLRARVVFTPDMYKQQILLE